MTKVTFDSVGQGFYTTPSMPLLSRAAEGLAIQKLGEVLTRPEGRDFILEYFEGSLIPVF
ncbi:MAG TPA: hypothetical protein VIK93_06845 [Limnochordales bacterium]